VRNAYADRTGFVADLAYKTRRLVEGSATQEGLGRLTKTVTFDVKTLEASSTVRLVIAGIGLASVIARVTVASTAKEIKGIRRNP
jgi:hypothetical protein